MPEIDWEDYYENSILTVEEVKIFPVVVHVIYNTSSQNISDSQILSQINVLNEDFRRMKGTNGFNIDDVGTDVRYEFRLANQDPNGNPTNGITRNYSNSTTFNIDDSQFRNDLSSLNYWDADKYLNIWVVPYITDDYNGNILGAASPPWISQMIVVIIANRFFGDNVGTIKSDYYQFGRTTTHELGHFFGLFHTFHNTPYDCDGVGDGVNDTPPVPNPTYGCPSSRYSCYPNDDVKTMIENYLDYTDDVCMNIFTQGQKGRMDYNLELDKYSLLTSSGLTSNDFIIFGEHLGDYEYNVSTSIVVKSDSPYSNLK